MKNFRRSLKFLWPYRVRLAISVACVIVIAVLWAGGLGMLVPASKVLISPEGLHGWAWDTLATHHLGAKLIRQRAPAGKHIDGVPIVEVLNVVKVDENGPAKKAGLRDGQWIVGLETAQVEDRIIPADALARRLAHVESGGKIRLRVFNPGSDTLQTVEFDAGQAPFTARMLGSIAKMIPEPKTKADRFPMLLWLLIIGVVVTLIRDVLRFVQEYLVQTAVFRGIVDLRCENYNVALKLPVTFFSEKGTSDTMSRFVQDTAELGRGQVTLFGKTLVEPAKAIASLTLAMMLNWELTLMVLIVGPPTFMLIRKLGKRMKKASRRALESWSGMLGVLDETLVGIRVVKAYTMEAAERKRFLRENWRLLKQQRRMAAIDSATAPSVEALGITAAMVASGIAGYMVFHDRMDPSIFLAWMACLAAMFDPVRKLAKVITRFNRSEAAAERIFELHDSQQEKRVPNAPTLERHSESIEFRDVSFRYPSASTDALRNVDITITAGQTVAVVGPNGSGKTTLVSLLPRLIDPSSGQVLIDGHDISKCSLRSLRRQIGVVTQDTVLFHASIAENIAYGLRRAKPQAVREAAEKAFVDEFVVDLPDGYDTMVGEHGATLSGGQKQRITIARAILRDPAILIFDEAMSQVDADSERRIHEAMEEFVKGRTTLMIAHRFATVLSADRIIVMNEGRIVDIGPHEKLLERCDLYRHLYDTQFRDSGG